MINQFVFQNNLIETNTESRTDYYEITVGEHKYRIAEIAQGKYEVEFNGTKSTVCCVIKKNKSYIDIDGLLIELAVPGDDGNNAGGAAGMVGEKDKIFAPMPGKIVKLLVKNGEDVKLKQPLVIVEAMKMEHQVNSPSDGKVKSINFADGDQVDTETPIIELDLEEN
jgi:biotin carboxyl carrier protein